jgi:hypothetical protein
MKLIVNGLEPLAMLIHPVFCVGRIEATPLLGKASSFLNQYDRVHLCIDQQEVIGISNSL